MFICCAKLYLPFTAQGNGDIRLVGPDTYAGRLEIYLNSQWGTVCDDGFGGIEANVVCHQVGHKGYLNYGAAIDLG